MTIPNWLKGYWGVVERAATTRMGSGALFNAINGARADNTQGPIRGVDAIQMGQIYSLAVQQRNAADAVQQLYGRIVGSTPEQATVLGDIAVPADLVTTTLRSASAAVMAVAPDYSIRYEYSYTDPTGNTALGYGYIHHVTLQTMSMTDVFTAIQAQITANITTPTITSLLPGSTYTFTGRANLLVL